MVQKVVEAAPVAKWTRVTLRRMLLDPVYVPPPLFLKLDDSGKLESRKVEIRRYLDADSQLPHVDKRYVGRYAKSAGYEKQMLDAVQNLPIVKEHFVGLRSHSNASSERHNTATNASGSGSKLITRWSGLSLSSWAYELLPAERLPFRDNPRALLALVRAVLRATEEFHKLGFVHCDLLLQNILLDAKFDADTGLFTFDLANLKIIDLEFSLTPVQQTTLADGGFVPARRADWFRDTGGTAITLLPHWHSDLLVSHAIDKDTGDLGAEHRDAQTRLAQADWGVDFFSVASWLKPLANSNFAKEKDYAAEIKLLKTLPQRLRNFDRKYAPGKTLPIRKWPHHDMIEEISRIIGIREPLDVLCFQLPSEALLAELDANPAPLPQDDASSFEESVFPDRAKKEPATAAGTYDGELRPMPLLPWLRRSKKWVASGAVVFGMAVAVGTGAASNVGSSLVAGVKRWLPDLPKTDATLANGSQLQPKPSPEKKPIPSPAPTPAQLMAQAEATLRAAPPGTALWQDALNSAAAIAAQPDQTQAGRSRFWAGVQTRYLQQTATIIASDWWSEGEPDKGTASPAQRDWLAASGALAKQGLWSAATYLERAIASRRGGIAPEPARVAQARANLAAWATLPELGPAPLPVAQITELRLDIAQLLTDIAVIEARDARLAKKTAPAGPVQQLLPLLQAVAALPSQHGHMLRGVAAACLMQPPDKALAQAEFTLAASVGTSADAAAIAKDARAWLAGQVRCV